MQGPLSLTKRRKKKEWGEREGSQVPLKIMFASLSWDRKAVIANKKSPLIQRRMEAFQGKALHGLVACEMLWG